MSLVSWNCRGLGNPQAIRFLKDLLVQKRPNIVFLCETYFSKEKVEQVRTQIGFDGCFVVEALGHSGGLIMLWQYVNDVSVLNFSNSHVDLKVSIPNLPLFRLTGFYGDPNRSSRTRGWSKIWRLAEINQLPWCLIGDLNNTPSHTDKKGGIPYPNWLIQGFQSVVSDCDLLDLPLEGHQYTWEKSRGTPNWVEVRLDRALVYAEWFLLFPNARLCNLGPSSSDHSPLFLDLATQFRFQHKRRFRFENAWGREPFCRQIVSDVWRSSRSASVSQKLQDCNGLLQSWGREITGNFRDRLTHSKAEMRFLRGSQRAEDIQRYEDLNNRFFDILLQKEIYWKRRAKQIWLQDGDHNTRFFHAWASKQRKSNTIRALKNDQGCRVDWGNGLGEIIFSYFTDLFTASDLCCDFVLECIEQKITPAQNDLLLDTVEAAEVKLAAFQMHSDKAPDPDGFNPGFFHKFWDVIGADITCMVQHFFYSWSSTR